MLMTALNAERQKPSLAGWVLFVPPALLGALIVTILVGGAAGWNPLWSPEDATLSEVVALGDIVTMRAMIASGIDPNAKYLVRENLVKSYEVQLTPLEAAVTTRERYVVEDLLEHGAVAGDAERHRLACFAHASGAKQIVSLFAPGDALLDCQGLTLPW